jgi:hypothetical protein
LQKAIEAPFIGYSIYDDLVIFWRIYHPVFRLRDNVSKPVPLESMRAAGRAVRNVIDEPRQGFTDRGILSDSIARFDAMPTDQHISQQ